MGASFSLSFRGVGPELVVEAKMASLVEKIEIIVR
jgi:hypothetical protein